MITRRGAGAGILASAAFAAAPMIAAAQEAALRRLPVANKEGGMPLMAALRLRHSTREYSTQPLAPQTLSDLLWAAFGINRPSGDRTAPYWRHVMVIDVLAAMSDGVWLYDPKEHGLLPYLPDDIRAQTGLQDFAAIAPLYWAKRLFVLCLSGSCERIPRCRRLSKARPGDEAANSPIRYLRTDGRLPPRLTGVAAYVGKSTKGHVMRR
jgi:hypothetical protein